jgi:hypothetical protein
VVKVVVLVEAAIYISSMYSKSTIPTPSVCLSPSQGFIDGIGGLGI